MICFFFFQAEDGIRDHCVTGVQTCALPISRLHWIQCLLERRVQFAHPERSSVHGAKNLNIADGIEPEALRNSRSEEHTSELQSHSDLVCRLLLEKKKQIRNI